MFINKNSITIDGTNIGSYLLDVKYSYNKLWASDTGRNLAGTMVGTLIGIFPKLTMHFRKLSSTELHTIATILDKNSVIVGYWDPYKNQQVTFGAYTGDWEYQSNRVGSASDFSCTFTSLSKRS